MNLRLKPTPGIYMVGMGSGKSTVGRHLAHRIGWNFFDTDAEIEAAEKTTIAEIFDTRGEVEFRLNETEILKQHVRWIERGRPAVVALGGGAFAQPGNRELLAGNGIAVWLDCPFETIQRRVSATGKGVVRPLAREQEPFAALYLSRREAYALADVRVPVETDDPEHIVAAILAGPSFDDGQTGGSFHISSGAGGGRSGGCGGAASSQTGRFAIRKIYVIGAGSGRRGRAVLGARIAAGLINVKDGHVARLRRIELNECGHPVPDERGVAGAARIAEIAARAGKDDLVVCLISGGASALMPLPADR